MPHEREVRRMVERLYSIPEAAEVLGISPITLGDWLRAKRITGTKIGRKWKITESDLQEFIERNRQV
jgi:excisionase family DNA binding protein